MTTGSRAEVHRWLREYAALLDECLLQVSEDQLSAEAAGRCQRFDARLRSFDVEVLRAAMHAEPGPALAARVQSSQARLDAVVQERMDRSAGELNGLKRGQSALRGYAAAGDHQRLGPSQYMEKRY